jgi:hypothetical protein
MRHQDVLRTLKRMIQKEKSPKTRKKLVKMYRAVLALSPKVKSIAKFNTTHGRSPASIPMLRAFTPTPVFRGKTTVARVKTPARKHTAANSVVPILYSPSKWKFTSPKTQFKVSPKTRKKMVTFAESVK